MLNLNKILFDDIIRHRDCARIHESLETVSDFADETARYLQHIVSPNFNL